MAGDKNSILSPYLWVYICYTVFLLSFSWIKRHLLTFYLLKVLFLLSSGINYLRTAVIYVKLSPMFMQASDDILYRGWY